MAFLTWVHAEWDRVCGFGLIALGGLALLLGYRGVSTSPYVAEELAYVVSGGLGGLFLLGVGATLLISADLHDEWRKLDAIQDLLRDRGTSGNGLDGQDQDALLALVPALVAALAAPTPARNGWRRHAGEQAPVGGPAGDAEAPPATLRNGHRLTLATMGVTLAGAAVAVLLAWREAATVADPQHAIDAAAVAVVALIVAGCANAGYTLWLRRRVAGREAALLAPLGLAMLLPAMQAAAGSPAAGGARSERDDEEVFVVEGLSRYHRPGCDALAAVEARAVRRGDVGRRLSACGLCGDG